MLTGSWKYAIVILAAMLADISKHRSDIAQCISDRVYIRNDMTGTIRAEPWSLGCERNCLSRMREHRATYYYQASLRAYLKVRYAMSTTRKVAKPSIAGH